MKHIQTHRQKSLGFTCAHCKLAVAEANDYTGTAHRDHCPYCLYSKHVDSEKPGDRKSSCNSKMKPVGLTFKNNSRELMIVYLCLGCGKWYKNRCAGDDAPEMLVQVFRDSVNFRTHTSSIPIQFADKTDAKIVLEGIYGAGFIPSVLRTEFDL